MDLSSLPRLGIGISTEPGSAAAGGVDAVRLAVEHPGTIDFLEYGGDLARGLDEHVRRWAGTGRPTTYHFLDLNLAERGDADAVWTSLTRARADQIGAAWLCGDGGLWHFGPRARGHEILAPPILTPESADEMAEALGEAMARLGRPVLPENPPAVAYVGELHVLDYFARVVSRAQAGMLLDCAHLAIFQRTRGLPALSGLDGFPLERVIELHVAGGTPAEADGFAWVEDSHVPELLPETRVIVEWIVPRAPALRAIVFECEKNPVEACLPGFAWLRALWDARAEAQGKGA